MGFVYCIQSVCGGPVKIGHTTDLLERLLHHQIGCPIGLRLLCARPGTIAKDELALHRRFLPQQVGGEWFTPVGQVLEFVHELGGALYPDRIWHPLTSERQRLRSIGLQELLFWMDEIRGSVVDVYAEAAKAVGKNSAIYVRRWLQDKTSPDHYVARQAEERIGIPAWSWAFGADAERAALAMSGRTGQVLRSIRGAAPPTP